MSTLTTTFEPVSLTFEASQVNEAALLALFGLPPEEPLAPTHALTIRQTVPAPPYVAVPVKRRGLTGKAYRTAKRRASRARRRWERLGRPMAEVATHVPHARMVAQDDGRVTFVAAPTLPPESRWYDLLGEAP